MSALTVTDCRKGLTLCYNVAAADEQGVEKRWKKSAAQ
jgi:hypothetical protein